MEDLTSWVSRQAQNMGIDFSCLSSHTRDQIISTLMSGLENGFRSRMDSPDLRFAKRRGIGKENQSSISTQSSNTTSNNSNSLSPDASDSSCAMPNNDDQINCPPIGTSCTTDTSCDLNCSIDLSCGDTLSCPTDSGSACPIDTECALMGSSCISDSFCPENDGWVCDNFCSNSQGQTCPERDNPATNCINDKCKDNSCINNIYHNCMDQSVSGCQDSVCANNRNCADAYPCNDSKCKNTLSCDDSGGITEEQSCLDSNCSNTTGVTGNGCGDGNDGTSGCRDLSCNNDLHCKDYGTTNIYCIDNGCLNSGTQTEGYSCIDINCNDNPCLNTDCSNAESGYNHCKDSTCVDSLPGGCYYSDKPKFCADLSPYCVCNDTNPNPNRSCTDGCGNNASLSLCSDQQCAHSNEQCMDYNGCVDNNCGDSRNCIDKEYSNSCTDSSCENGGEESQCIDDTNCHDNSCINSNFCMNETSCSDNLCTNSEKCVNSPSSSCLDTQCNNTGQCDQLSKNDSVGCTDAMCP